MSQLTPLSTTVNDMCSAALKECGAYGIGQTPTQEDLNDAWARLQWMLQEWGEDSMMVWRERTITVQKVDTSLLPTDPDQGTVNKPVYYFPVGPDAGVQGGFDTNRVTPGSIRVNAATAFKPPYTGALMTSSGLTVAPGLSVLDVTGNFVLGSVLSYGPIVNSGPTNIEMVAAGAWVQGATTIPLQAYAIPSETPNPLKTLVPGLTINDYDARPAPDTLGTLVDLTAVPGTMTLTPAAFGTTAPHDTLGFSSLGNDVLFLNAAFPFASIGAGDLLQFSGPPFPDVLSEAPRRIKRAFLRQPSSGGMPIDYPLQQLNSMGDYSRIALKGMVSFPGAYFYDSAWPMGRLFLYPLPNNAIYGVGIVLRDQLPIQFLTLLDQFELPFIYYNAIYTNLAMRLRPHFGMRTFPGDLLPDLAKGARAAMKNTSVQISELELPQELSRPGVYNIFSDRSY